MTPGVFAALMVAALMHAGWNALVKGAADKWMSTLGLAAGGGAIAAMILPFVPAPSVQIWPFVAASTLLQMIYYRLVARTYATADMSQAYPVMRGTAPLFVASLGVVVFGERLGLLGWAGIATISGAILALALGGRGRAGLGWALATAVVICAYTLVDAAGVRRSGAAAGYTLWIFLTTGLAMTAVALMQDARGLVRHLARHGGAALIGGAGSLLSYGIALWAMTRAPVAMVAALRETSILFAVAISAVVLRERVGPARLLAALAIAAGAGLLRLA